MGEAADMLLSGLMCEGCGVFIDGDEPGYPRHCDVCLEAFKPKRGRPKGKRPGAYRRRVH